MSSKHSSCCTIHKKHSIWHCQQLRREREPAALDTFNMHDRPHRICGLYQIHLLLFADELWSSIQAGLIFEATSMCYSLPVQVG